MDGSSKQNQESPGHASFTPGVRSIAAWAADPLAPMRGVCYINGMLGKHARNTIVLAFSLALCASAGCVKNVSQSAKSGKDQRFKGAKTIELEGGEARVNDIVTYPGSDRVDWKVFEIPEGLQGDMDIRVRWRPARPGMGVGVNVYDQYFDRLERIKRLRTSSKKIKVRNLKPGKYYIQIYAPKRIDAGKYRLSLRFRERKPPKVPTLEELAGQIDDPPVLPAVIEPVVKTPEQIAAEEADKQRLADEKAAADLAAADDAAKQAELDKPVFARVRRTQSSGSGGVIITISVGRNKGIERDWVGTLLNGKSKDALPDGDFKIIKVTASESIAKVRLSVDQVKANSRVRLQRP